METNRDLPADDTNEAVEALPASGRARHLGDFNVTARVLVIAAWAVPVGVAAAGAAYVLLRLIALITNLVFYQRLDTTMTAPGLAHHSPLLIVAAPVAGGLVVGLMARFGSEKIRGHGMPEAIEAILTGGSRVQPRVALLKPISAAISIGTGGPFGAEGPIIMTGGALGSILAQVLRLSADERKTLLVAGAAGGMAATFNSPLASVLLAVELLLFEWRPRSFIPVTTSVAVATLLRGPMLGFGPVFGVPPLHVHMDATTLGICLLAGLSGGALAVAATFLVYFAEDAFSRLRFHWMWWPAIGGLIIGVGGLAEPRALGVGYDVIGELLSGRAALSLIVGILIVKTLIWSLSLGSGTSGGVLAPVFMIGAALGAAEGHLIPAATPALWAIAGLAAVVGGVMRSPLTGVIFTLELTHAWNTGPALLIASASAYALSVLTLKRSVLTEKIARRGLHLTREYSTDPLEAFFASDVMATEPTVLRPGQTVQEALRHIAAADGGGQHLYPVTGEDGRLLGVLPHARLLSAQAGGARRTAVSALLESGPLSVRDDDTLRHVAYVLAEHDITQVPVTASDGTVNGLIALPDLLHARLHDLTEEHHRQRLLPVRPLPRRPAEGRRDTRAPGRGTAERRQHRSRHRDAT
ncbi:chloride channel protein [Actinoallomurus oryzae]|uniref:Chloride channel protein n=1 Tax=Actinoallomurus oryzae TaxID=502180 RepID=A0ABP8QWS0_9ACTN